MLPHGSWSGSTDWSAALPGDVKLVGNGASELRLDYGPGYRVYYLREGRQLILLLSGGDTSSQDSDIKTAHQIAQEWRSNRGAQR